MPKITRKQQKVFAVNASNNGVFGSLQANDPVYSQDPDAIQGRTAYSNGWNDATYSAEKLPPLEEFQSLQYLFSRQIAYLMQDGIAEWNSSTTYYKGSLVKAIQQDGSFVLYASLIDDNTGNQVTDTTKWVITNTSTNFHQGIPNWRADVIYSQGDWVKALNDGSWSIFESTQNNNLNNDITDADYWKIRPFTTKLPLLWHDWFDHELEDVSWLRADTFSWQNGTVYSDVYDHLVDDYTNGTSQTETVGSYTITYKLATDGHKITTDETNVLNIYNESGVAWYYILDTANQRFKLPRENPAKEVLGQLAAVVGNGKTLGLTDGNGNFGLNSRVVSGYNGFAYMNGNAYGTDVGTSISGETPVTAPKSVGLSIEPNNTGVIADLSQTTGVYKGKQYLYFYIGQFTQSATEQTAGINTELFNGKLDLDLGNASNTTREKIVGWCVPDYSAGVSITQNTDYTLPSDGVVIIAAFNASTGANASVWMSVYNSSGTEILKLGNRFQAGNATNNYACVIIPLQKGMKVNGDGTNVTTFAFYPMKGV